MSAASNRSLLLLIRRPPYGSSLARAAIDLALAAAVFEQPVSLLFVGDGVLQLVAGQDPRQQGLRNLEKLLSSLPLYDVEQVYVDAEAAARYQLDLAAAPLQVTALDPPAMAALLTSHDHLLGF